MARPRRRFRRRFLFDAFDVLIGPEREGRFASDDEWDECVTGMEAWYRVNGEAFEADHLSPGSRSWAWWRFVQGEDVPSHGEEFARLQKFGVLTAAEELEGTQSIETQLSGK